MQKTAPPLRFLSLALLLVALLGGGWLHASVTLESDASADTAGGGEYVTVTLTYKNLAGGAQTAANLVAELDLVSPEFSFVPGSAEITLPGPVVLSGGAADPVVAGNDLTWDIDALLAPAPAAVLANGEEMTIIFDIKVGCEAATSQFRADVDVVLSDTGPFTFTDLYSLTVAHPSLLLTLTPSAQTVELADGAEVVWTATIQNVGLGNAYNLAARFGLDDSLVYINGSATVGSISQGGTLPSAPGVSIDGDTVTVHTWRLGADLTSNPGAGDLADLDGDGEWDDLPSGGSVTITNIRAQLQDCEPIGLYFDATVGFDGEACIDTATTDPIDTQAGYVSTIPGTPDFTYEFAGLTDVPYCSDRGDATFTITNPAGKAPVSNLEFTLGSFPAGIDFVFPASQGAGAGLHTVISNLDDSDPQVLSGANAVTFDRATGKFENFPILDSGKKITLTFDVESLLAPDAFCSNQALSQTMTVTPSYTDLCGSPYSPLPGSTTLTRDDPVRLRLDTSHTGTDKIFIGDASRTYSVSATYSAIAGDPWDQLSGAMPITLTYTYDAALVYVGSSGTGLYVAPDDPAANPLTWTGLTFDELNDFFTADLEFSVKDRDDDPCQAGREYTNTFTVEEVVLTDCLDCTYTLGGNTTFRGFINQQKDYLGTPIDFMNKTVDYIDTLAGSQGEACRPYQYTVTVDFGGGAPDSWDGMDPGPAVDPDGTSLTELVLIERPSQGQTFHELRSVIYNAVDYGPTGTGDITNADVTTFANGEIWLFLGKLDGTAAPKPDAGHVLEIVWEFDPPTTFGQRAEFSEIRWPTADSLCGTEFGYEHGVWVTVGEQTLGAAINSPAYVLRGDVETHSFTISRLNGAHFAYDLLVTVDLDPDNTELDFSYLEGSRAFSGFLDAAGNPVAAFEPAVVGTTLVWDFREEGYRVLSATGQISMDLLTSPCEPNPQYTVKVDYNRYCGYEADPAGTGPRTAGVGLRTFDRPVYGPNLSSTMVPFSRTLYENSELWVLRLANNGIAPAWNVGLTATFGDAFELASAELISAAQADDPDAAEGNGLDILQGALPNPDNPQVWTFQGVDFAADPDGAGGLADADGDGIYDDLPPGAVAYVLVRLNYVDCDTTKMTIGLAGEAGGELPGTSYDPLPTPGDMVTTRPGPGGFCCACAGTTGAIRVASSVLQTIHVNPTLELCASRPLVFRSRAVRQGTIYQPVFRQFVPKHAEAGVSVDLDNATYAVDLDGDGIFEWTGVLPAPTIIPGAPGDPDEYRWTHDQFGTIFDDGMPFGAIVELRMDIWGDCPAANQTLTLGSRMDYTILCGDSVSTNLVQTSVTVLPFTASVAIEARNLSAGQTDWSEGNVAGGAGDVIEYRLTITNDGSVKVENAQLEADLPNNFATIDSADPAWTSQVGNVVLWDKDALLGDIGGELLPAASRQVTFRATLGGGDCTNNSSSMELKLGCLPVLPYVGECLFDTSIDTHQLVTEPVMQDPQIVITGSDLVTGDGDSDEIDTNGLITIEVTGEAGSAANLVLTPTIPAGWAWDGHPGTVFSYTSPGSGEPEFVAGVDDCDVDDSDPAKPVFTFTRGGVPAHSFLREDEVLAIQFYVVQDSAFDTTDDRLVATETVGSGLDPAPPADLFITADLDYTDTCGDNATTVTKSETLTVHTPDLDVEITGDNPGIVRQVGDTRDLSVVVANNGENTFAENGVLTVTIGDAWQVNSGLAAFAGTMDLSDPAYEWIESPAQPGEYYLQKAGGGDPGLFVPTDVYQGVNPLGSGGPGTLGADEWGWGDNDALGFSTVYVNVGGIPTLMTADVPAVTVPPTVADTRVLVADIPDLAQAATATYNFTIELVDADGLFAFEAHVEAPILRQDGVTEMGNYSFDTHAAALVGFTLTKNLDSTSEADSTDPTVWIGEDASFQVVATWFGIQPGDTVTGATVADELSDGQGYVQHTVDSTPGAVGTDSAPTTPATLALTDGGTLTWVVNDFGVDGSFDTTITARTLNVAGNTHDQTLDDTVDASFAYLGKSFTSTTPGFSPLADREETVTVSRPDPTFGKEVRNVTTGSGWSSVGVDAKAGDVLEYRLTLANAALRAPLYDIVVTDTVPAKFDITPFAGDGLDNDGDGTADVGGEGNVAGQLITFNAANTSNANFAKLDGDDSIVMLYRVTVTAAVNPTETLLNSAEVTGDSLAGASGSQLAPQGATDTQDGALLFTIEDDTTVTILPLDITGSKSILAVSNSGLAGPSPYTGGDQEVVIGEEIRYQLQFTVVPSTMEDLVIRDLLPAGLTVIEAADLSFAAPFTPLGPVVPVIDTFGGQSRVTWDVGAVGNVVLPGGSGSQIVQSPSSPAWKTSSPTRTARCSTTRTPPSPTM